MAAEPATPYQLDESAPGGFDRLTWGIMAGVLLLVVISIEVVIQSAAHQPPLDLTSPAGVALAFEQDLQQGNADQAWGLLSSEAQAGRSQQNFLSASAFRDVNARYAVDNVRVDGDTAHLDLLVTHDYGPGLFGLSNTTSTQRLAETLQRENGEWRILVPAEPYLLPPRSG